MQRYDYGDPLETILTVLNDRTPSKLWWGLQGVANNQQRQGPAPIKPCLHSSMKTGGEYVDDHPHNIRKGKPWIRTCRTRMHPLMHASCVLASVEVRSLDYVMLGYQSGYSQRLGILPCCNGLKVQPHVAGTQSLKALLNYILLQQFYLIKTKKSLRLFKKYYSRV